MNTMIVQVIIRDFSQTSPCRIRFLQSIANVYLKTGHVIGFFLLQNKKMEDTAQGHISHLSVSFKTRIY